LSDYAECFDVQTQGNRRKFRRSKSDQQRLRARYGVPVIITTEHRRDEIDPVVGLELGNGGPNKVAVNLAFGNSTDALGVSPTPTVPRSRWQRASKRSLLVAFLDAPQRPLSREHLLQATRIHKDVFDRSIDVPILRLRRKLETNPSTPRIIQSERGVGYVFTLPVEPI
jgi:two-component system, OmpR family, response regulator